MQLLGLLLVTLLCCWGNAAAAHDSSFLWPLPANYTYYPDGANVTISPCDVKYEVNAADKVYIE